MRKHGFFLSKIPLLPVELIRKSTSTCKANYTVHTHLFMLIPALVFSNLDMPGSPKKVTYIKQVGERGRNVWHSSLLITHATR
ncbi:hypothetical protein GDO81_000463 [Engystomops pustulosus]|uniref:Uncharacterized protein n=1 Tax=Engystomops pustulosus TaxID=76066 RepID=A0AAV7D8H0_ENGPU|nr:hypothetical protein GDO81_000463 [Engystomops pustulosus]